MTNKKQMSRQMEHFERLYHANEDPWNYQTSRYERTKYEASLAVLGTKRYMRGLEVGCSIGVLTGRLAARCYSLIGLDFVPSAITAARRRCAAYSWVEFELMQVPRQWPLGSFDLIVLSEVLYFLADDDLRQIAALVIESIAPEGDVLLVNYTEPTDDPQSGESAASLFIAATVPPLQIRRQRREDRYRIDLLSRYHGSVFAR
jgi:2-polyprenyl-3-methyl-5-hydroxy-6-metoxy-1,4-benzoquinol methylase